MSKVRATRASRSPVTDRISENHTARNSATPNTSRNVARGATTPFVLSVGLGPICPSNQWRQRAFIITQPGRHWQQVVPNRSRLVEISQPDCYVPSIGIYKCGEQAVHAGADVPHLDRAGRGGAARIRDYERCRADLRRPGPAAGRNLVCRAGSPEGRRLGHLGQGRGRGRAAAPLLPDHRRGHRAAGRRGHPGARQCRRGREPAGAGRGDGVRMPAERQVERRRNRLERRYRRLLALYPRDHRREHAEEMVGVLLAMAAHDIVSRGASPAPRAAAAATRIGRDIADSTDLVTGAIRSHARMAVSRSRPRGFSRLVRDPRWSDALAVLSVVTPVLLLVAALADFGIPQAVANAAAGHPDWRGGGRPGAGAAPPPPAAPPRAA